MRALALALTAALAVGLAACGSSDDGSGGSGGGSAADKGPIVVASWGGTFSRATKDFLAEPFTKETGIEVKIVDAPGTQLATIEAQHKAGQMKWDMVDSIIGNDAFLLDKQGLLEHPPASMHAAFEQELSKQAVEPFGYAFGNLGYVVVCNKDLVDRCPTTMSQFFDDEAYPGSRVICAACTLAGLTQAQVANGTSPADTATTPIDLDAAIKRFDDVKSSIKVFADAGDQMDQVMRTGEAGIGVIYSGRAYRLQDEGVNLQVSWDEGTYESAYWAVLKGSEHKPAALRFLRWIADHPQAQAKWADALQYSVPNPKAFDSIDPKVARILVDNPANRFPLARLNYAWMVANNDRANAAWKAMVAG